MIWDKNDFPDDLFKIFEQLGIGEDSWHTSPIAIPKVKIGRPKFEKAFECFKSMNFDRGSLSWKELINLIAEKTGEIPNESTYRSWVRKNKGNG
ncbi:MAG: hypothetical protein JKX71_04170 [Amylibacter sp.]|nr:hypothetical protein [Amylibacter sp.]